MTEADSDCLSQGHFTRLNICQQWGLNSGSVVEGLKLAISLFRPGNFCVHEPTQGFVCYKLLNIISHKED